VVQLGKALRLEPKVNPIKRNQAMEEQVGAGLGMAIALLIWVVFGAIVGWLASLVVKGTGLGLPLDIVLGIVGAVVGGWLSQALGISIGSGIVSALLTAVIGAVLVLVIVKFVRKA
jgi:uncharacterized membrane protein YeaQ/YmgE (transglycosylase-associated protein family)